MKRAAKMDVIWILVDGIRPDKLACCGNRSREQNYLDEILLEGALFTKVVAGGANSKTSMHAAFTSLPPSINGVNAYDPDLQVNLDPRLMTLTDMLRSGGYRTFRYVDMVDWLETSDKHQVVPSSGFHVWESSGHPDLKSTPAHSFATTERDRFIEQFNHTTGPKFAYFHLLTSHEVNVESMRQRATFTLSSEIYERNLGAVCDDLRDVMGKLEFREDSLLVVSTDHGARLDLADIAAEERAHGMRLRDISMNTFCSFRHQDLGRSVCHRMVRTIDIAPTILDLTDCPPLSAAGISLLPVLRGEGEAKRYAFMETGGILEVPPCTDRSNIWGVRTEHWKFWLHETHGRWLGNLDEDPAEEHNLAGQGLAIEDELHEALQRELLARPTGRPGPADEPQAGSETSTSEQRQRIPPEISIFLITDGPSPHLSQAIDAVRSQLAVYWELIVLDRAESDAARAQVAAFRDFRISYRSFTPGTALLKITESAGGTLVSVLHADQAPLPFCYYELMKASRSGPRDAVVRGAHFLRDHYRLVTRPVRLPSLPATVAGSSLDLGSFFLVPAELLAGRARALDWSPAAGFRMEISEQPPTVDIDVPLGFVHADPGALVLSYRVGRELLRRLLVPRAWSRAPRKARRLLSQFLARRRARRTS